MLGQCLRVLERDRAHRADFRRVVACLALGRDFVSFVVHLAEVTLLGWGFVSVHVDVMQLELLDGKAYFDANKANESMLDIRVFVDLVLVVGLQSKGSKRFHDYVVISGSVILIDKLLLRSCAKKYLRLLINRCFDSVSLFVKFSFGDFISFI